MKEQAWNYKSAVAKKCEDSVIIIDINDNDNPIPVSIDTAQKIYNGAVVILRDTLGWYIVQNVSNYGEKFPCNLYLTIQHDDMLKNYIYDINNKILRFMPAPQ